MPHSPNIVDEAFVDLWSLTRADVRIYNRVLSGEEILQLYGERLTP